MNHESFCENASFLTKNKQTKKKPSRKHNSTSIIMRWNMRKLIKIHLLQILFSVCPVTLALADSALPPTGCLKEVPNGAQEQRGELGEVPSRAEEVAAEEPGQQAPVQVR